MTLKAFDVGDDSFFDRHPGQRPAAIGSGRAAGRYSKLLKDLNCPKGELNDGERQWAIDHPFNLSAFGTLKTAEPASAFGDKIGTSPTRFSAAT